jgi:type IV secretion system protein TrbL
MNWLRRPVVLGTAILVLATALVVTEPRPTSASADIGGAIACGAANGGVGVLGGIAEDVTGGAIGGGNPLGDLCSKVAGKVTGAITAPVTSALKGLGDDVFKEMTKWVAQGAGWLMGQVVEAVDSSTTPHLRQDGFLAEYTKMSGIAVLLAVAALLAAILQGIAQGNAALLLRVVLVNTPLAFIGTSVAFVVVQLLVGATDSLCHAITAGTGDHGVQLFEAAITDLGKVGGDIGEAGTGGGISAAQGHNSGQVAVPLFVGFLLAIVGAFAALCVLLELLFRDAGIYAVSLFMPFALYASIAPRWRGVMRRYGEALFALIESKFIIVAIITLAGTLVAKEDTSVEVVLVASALMALSCFAPFLLFRIVAISEGAAAASFGRRSAGGAVVGGASRGAQTARSVQAMAGGSKGSGGSGVHLWNAKDLAQSRPKPPGSPPGGGGGKGAGGSGSGDGPGGSSGPGGGSEGPPRPPGGGSGSSPGPSTTGAGKAATGAGAAAGPVGAVGSETAKTPQKAADRLSETGVAKSAGGGGAGTDGRKVDPKPDTETGGGATQARGHAPGAGGSAERRPRPDSESGVQAGGPADGSPPAGAPAERPPRPPSQRPEKPEDGDAGDRS